MRISAACFGKGTNKKCRIISDSEVTITAFRRWFLQENTFEPQREDYWNGFRWFYLRRSQRIFQRRCTRKRAKKNSVFTIWNLQTAVIEKPCKYLNNNIIIAFSFMQADALYMGYREEMRIETDPYSSFNSNNTKFRVIMRGDIFANAAKMVYYSKIPTIEPTT